MTTMKPDTLHRAGSVPVPAGPARPAGRAPRRNPGALERALGNLRRHTQFFLDVRVDNVDVETALESVHAFAAAGNRALPARRVFFTNVHTIHLARRHPEFRRCVNEAEMVLADGSGLKLAGMVFGSPIRENLNGTDFTPKVFRLAELQHRTLYLLGARPEVVEACDRRLAERYPGLRIVGHHSGFFDGDEEEAVIREINALRPDILLVALGSPLQELWISRHRDRLHARVCLAVGGLFDFVGGIVRRAPAWMRALGVEWAYRFVQDPLNKWRRVFVEIPGFLFVLALNRLLPGAAGARTLPLRRA